MARLALTVVGMGVGFMLGGPFGAQIGAMIGGIVGNVLFGPTIEGPRLSDLNVTSSTYGQCIPELYGTMRMGGNLIWTTGLIEHKKKSGGGKGGPKQTTYTYTASFAIAFCKGEVNDVLRLWADGKLISGNSPLPPLDLTDPAKLVQYAFTLGKGKNKKKYKFRIYRGSEDQEPDSIIEAKEGAGKVPAYRGLCYVVFDDMPLDDFGNRIPQITAEITKNAATTMPELHLTPSTGNSYVNVARTQAEWSNNRFMSFDSGNHQIVTYDALTMRETNRVTLSNHDFGNNSTNNTKPTFSVGGGYFIDELDAPLGTNSRPLGIWEAASGTFLGHIGLGSFVISEWPLGAHTGPYYPEGAWIGGLGSLNTFRVSNASGQNDYIINQGISTGGMVIYSIPDRTPVWVGEGGFTVLRGAERVGSAAASGSSDVIMLKGGGPTGVRLRVLTVPEGSVGTYTGPDGGGHYNFVNAALVTMTEVNLNPFGDANFYWNSAAYDASDNSLVLWGNNGSGGWRFAKYLISEGVWKWTKKASDFPGMYLDSSLAVGGTGNGGFPAQSTTQSNLQGGSVAWGSYIGSSVGAYLYVADLGTGSITKAIPYTNSTFGWSANYYDDVSSSLWCNSVRIYFRGSSSTVTVQSIVNDVLQKTGMLAPGDFDTSALAATTVNGYTISRDTTAKDILAQLASAYFFDGVESDYVIKIVSRGQAPVGNITEAHLGFVKDHDVTVEETRVQEVELPMRVTITYSDPARDYQTGTQFAKRNTNPVKTMYSKQEQKFELPISMTATEAKRIADKSLKMAWTGRASVKTVLPWEFIIYDPSDVVTLTMKNGTVYTLRFTKMDLGANYNIAAESVTENTTAYVSAVVGSSGTGVPAQSAADAPNCDLFIFNTPLLRDTDDTQGISSVFYIAAASQSPGIFGNCYVFESDDGIEYIDKSLISVEVTHGRVKEALPARFTYAIDCVNTLTVTVANLTDTLASITEDQLLAGGNPALVGKEVIQYQNAVLNADGTYTLSNLLRARRGTNYATGSHTTGERFIVLDAAKLQKMFNSPSDWSSEHYFKAVPPGTLSEDQQSMGVLFEPNDLKPYSPENVACTDDGTNVTITFARRSRIAYEITDGVDEVSYREGQGPNARCTYEVYSGKALSDKPWLAASATPPSFSGTVPIFTPVGGYNPLTFQFPVAGVMKFVVVIREIGFVTGVPKIVQFDRASVGDWSRTELY